LPKFLTMLDIAFTASTIRCRRFSRLLIPRLKPPYQLLQTSVATVVAAANSAALTTIPTPPPHCYCSRRCQQCSSNIYICCNFSCYYCSRRCQQWQLRNKQPLQHLHVDSCNYTTLIKSHCVYTASITLQNLSLLLSPIIRHHLVSLHPPSQFRYIRSKSIRTSVST
ncbi:hypothetical protein L9F63_028198, partial [Diploptera punctata]